MERGAGLYISGTMAAVARDWGKCCKNDLRALVGT